MSADELILVTGATGFVGQHLMQLLSTRGCRVRGAARNLPATMPSGLQMVRVGDQGPHTDWREAVTGVSTIVHLASRVHVMRETASDAEKLFHDVNVLGGQRLAQQAVEAGVRRMVFLSSIKVNGERTDEVPFSEQSAPAPCDPYGVSKLHAEQALAQIKGLEVVIVRPPLVYGAGVKGNMLRFLSLARRGVPLPLGRVNNRRSMVAVANLCDLLALCVAHPAAAGELFLVADNEAISTPQLLRRLAQLMNRPARIVPFPMSLLKLAARLGGAGDIIGRLTDSLEINADKVKRVLGWSPPHSLDSQLAEMVHWYLHERSSVDP